MAKDKEFEAKYKAERLRRAHLRKQKRKDARQDSLYRYGRRGDSYCSRCGGTMNWCSCCQMWSQSCCVEYGTCACS
jgi:hypothetical protein